MAKSCAQCNVLKTELETARVEAVAVRQDQAARVESGESTPAKLTALLKETMKHWRAAAEKYEDHRTSHFSK